MATKSLYNFRVAAVGKPSALRKLRAVGSPDLLFPQTEENLSSSAVSLSRYYWLHALRSRVTEALGEDTATRLLGARWDCFDYGFCIHYVRRRKLGEAEQVAAEEAARDLIRELPTAELTSEESELLDRACRLGELWAMLVDGG